MIRVMDIFFSFMGLIFLLPLLVLLLLAMWLESGYPLFFQKRVGRNQEVFLLIKIRTMKLDTVSVGTHLLNSDRITFLGHFLRIAKLDELPQLWNVLKGDMSIVGPRPCLINQYKLILERKKFGVFKLRPGITGLAQVKSIDMSTPKLLAQTEHIMIKKLNLFYYFYLIFLTILKPFFKKIL